MKENDFERHSSIPEHQPRHSDKNDGMHEDGWIAFKSDIQPTKPICVVDLTRRDSEFTMPAKVNEFCDWLNIPDYEAKSSYRLTVVFIEQSEDWTKHLEGIIRIKEVSDNFVLFCNTEPDGCRHIGIPYISTTEHPQTVMESICDIFFGGYPMPIDFNDFKTFLSSDEKNGAFIRTRLSCDSDLTLPSFSEYLNGESPSNALILISIPKDKDNPGYLSQQISKVIRAISREIDVLWGCSFTEDTESSMAVFVK